MSLLPHSIEAIQTVWKKPVHVLSRNIGFVILIVAAALLELTTAVMYYTAQNIIQRSMERYVESEMRSSSLTIHNQLSKVEVAVNNMMWVVQRNLNYPDSMYMLARHLVVNNPTILGSSIMFVPEHFPQKGYYFEPYAARRADGTIELMQLGSPTHDYTKQEFFTAPIEKDGAHWAEPYVDSDGAQAKVTTFGRPVHDRSGKIVAVVDADLSIDWLNEIIEAKKVFSSTQRFLISKEGNLLAGADNTMLKMIVKNPEFFKYTTTNTGYKGSHYTTMTDENGEKLHVFFQPVGGQTGWTIIHVCYDSDIFGHLRQVRRFLLLMVLAGFVLLSFIIYRTSRYLSRLHKVNAEKHRISNELRVAADIQMSMLPRVFPPFSERKDIDLYASMTPAKEVGGDLYSFFLLNERLYIAVGDVSGKGVPASLFMAQTTRLFRTLAGEGYSPEDIAYHMNSGLCEGNNTMMFITLFIGVIDLQTGQLDFCNCGHNPPIINGQLVTFKYRNRPLGIIDGIPFQGESIPDVRGKQILIYTDGLNEAMNSKKELLGNERLLELMINSQEFTACQVVEMLKKAVEKHRDGADPNDDLTLLCLRISE